MIIPNKCKAFLEKNVPNYESIKDINDLLNEVDDIIVLKGMDSKNDYELTELGREAQQIWDKIYWANYPISENRY